MEDIGSNSDIKTEPVHREVDLAGSKNAHVPEFVYCNDDPCTPYFARQAIVDNSVITRIVLQALVGKQIMPYCSKTPYRCMKNATFLVDMPSIEHRRGLLLDGLGTFMNCSNTDTYWKFSDNSIRFEERKNSNTRLRTTYFTHKKYKDFHRRTVVCTHEGVARFALLIYFFNGPEHEIEVETHGNRRIKKNYACATSEPKSKTETTSHDLCKIKEGSVRSVTECEPKSQITPRVYRRGKSAARTMWSERAEVSTQILPTDKRRKQRSELAGSASSIPNEGEIAEEIIYSVTSKQSKDYLSIDLQKEKQSYLLKSFNHLENESLMVEMVEELERILRSGMAYLNDDLSTPYFTRNAVTNKHAANWIFLQALNCRKNLPLCRKTPLKCMENATFLIDMSCIKHHQTLTSDGLGPFQIQTGWVAYWKVDKNTIKPASDSDSNTSIKTTYYTHKTERDFRRRTIVCTHKGVTRFALLIYSFTGQEHAVDVNPDSNVRSKRLIGTSPDRETLEPPTSLASAPAKRHLQTSNSSKRHRALLEDKELSVSESCSQVESKPIETHSPKQTQLENDHRRGAETARLNNHLATPYFAKKAITDKHAIASIFLQALTGRKDLPLCTRTPRKCTTNTTFLLDTSRISCFFPDGLNAFKSEREEVTYWKVENYSIEEVENTKQNTTIKTTYFKHKSRENVYRRTVSCTHKGVARFLILVYLFTECEADVAMPSPQTSSEVKQSMKSSRPATSGLTKGGSGVVGCLLSDTREGGEGDGDSSVSSDSSDENTGNASGLPVHTDGKARINHLEEILDPESTCGPEAVYLNNDIATPYFSKTAILNKHATCRIFLDALAGKKNLPMCTRTPYKCKGSATFLVDMSVIKNPRDLLLDGLGVFVAGSRNVCYWKMANNTMVESTTKPTDNTTLESAAETTDNNTMVESAAEPTDNNTMVESAAEPTDNNMTVESAAKTTDNNTTVESAAEPTDNTTVESAAETTDNNTTVESAAEPTDNNTMVESASEPTDNNTTVESAAETTDNNMMIESAAETTDNNMMVESAAETTDNNTTVESTTKPTDNTTVESATEPTDLSTETAYFRHSICRDFYRRTVVCTHEGVARFALLIYFLALPKSHNVKTARKRKAIVKKSAKSSRPAASGSAEGIELSSTGEGGEDGDDSGLAEGGEKKRSEFHFRAKIPLTIHISHELPEEIVLSPETACLNDDATTPYLAKQAITSDMQTYGIVFLHASTGRKDMPLCTSVPQRCMTNATFLLDMSCIRHVRKLVCDGLGSFKNESGRVIYWQVGDDHMTRVQVNKSNATVRTTYFKHKFYHDFRRKIVVYTHEGVPRFALLIYSFSGQEHEIKTFLHGNATRKIVTDPALEPHDSIGRKVAFEVRREPIASDLSASNQTEHGSEVIDNALPRAEETGEAKNIERHSITRSRESTDTSSASDGPYLNGDTATPYISRDAVKDKYAIASIFVEALKGKSGIPLCTKIPYRCMKNGTFLIDMSSLGDPRGLLRDGLGAFKNASGTITHWKVDDDTIKQVEVKLSNSTIKTTYFKHKCCQDFFRRLVIFSYEGLARFALLVYFFTGPEHEIDVATRVRTMPARKFFYFCTMGNEDKETADPAQTRPPTTSDSNEASSETAEDVQSATVQSATCDGEVEEEGNSTTPSQSKCPGEERGDNVLVPRNIHGAEENYLECIRRAEVVYLNDDNATPYFARQALIDKRTHCKIFFLALNNKQNMAVCTKVPYKCMTNATFLIDISNITCARDLLSDGLGYFKNLSGVYTYWKFGANTVEEVEEKASNTHLRTTYYRHKASGDFFRRTVVCTYKGVARFALLIYSFIGEEQEVVIAPHGNRSKKKRPFSYTIPSAESLVTTEVQNPATSQGTETRSEAATGVAVCTSQEADVVEDGHYSMNPTDVAGVSVGEDEQAVLELLSQTGIKSRIMHGEKELEIVPSTDVAYLNDNAATPYFARRAILNLGSQSKVFLHALVNKQDLAFCTKTPYRCMENATFLIDLSYMNHSRDILCDGLGTYKNESGKFTHWKVGNNTIERTEVEHGNTKLRSTYFTHNVCKDFHRKTIVCTHEGVERFALLIYTFTGPEHEIEIASPDTSKKQRASTCATLNIRKKRKSTALDSHDDTWEAVSSIMSGNNEVLYTRGHSPVRPTKRSRNSKGVDTQNVKRLIHMKANSESPILSIDQTSPHGFSAILATAFQIQALEHFCTKARFGILEIGTTYNCGEFYVTPTTFRHPMLLQSDSKIEPTLIGPTLIHTEQDAVDTYNTFAFHLVAANPALQDMQYVGSDRSLDTILDGFRSHMPFLKSILCKKHIEADIVEYLTSKSVLPDHVKEVISYVFDVLAECLSDDDFDYMLTAVKARWRVIDEDLHSWFTRFYVNSFKTSVMRKVRVGAGIQNQYFFNNGHCSANELLGNVLSDRPNLLEFVKEWTDAVSAQRSDCNRSLLGEGAYLLKDQYENLKIRKREWSDLSEVQREKAMGLFMCRFHR